MQNKLLRRIISKADDTEVENLFSPQVTQRGKAPAGVMRSHDYEAEESPVWRSYEAAALFRDRGKFWTSGKKRGLRRWLLTLVIGILTAFAAVTITYFTGLLIDLKFQACTNLLHGSGGAAAAFPAFLFFNLFFVFVANFVVRVEPSSAGSGVPEIKTWLNGVAIPRLVRAHTLLMKAVGVTFSVAGGLPCGKEGPMVQIGSGLAAGLAQGKSTTMGFDTSFSKFQDFRNDQEKRDFVACGAAAGVASAFGAPIAGVLFTLEESASFWSTKLTWRTFFCTLTAVYTLFLIRSARSWFGKLEQTFMFNFGEFYDLESDMANYSVWELLIFVGIGCVGGLVGAATVRASKQLTLKRLHQTPHQKCVEVHAVCLAASFLAFFLPLLFGKCTHRPDPLDEDASYTAQEQKLIGELVQFTCPESEYNELASLWFVAPETAIKQLFHYRAPFNDLSKETFGTLTLVLFLVPYQCVFAVMIGCAVPGGVFIPSMIAGAALGRLVGHTLLHAGGSSSSAVVASTILFADKGTYALMGAAAALSGLTRLTIAATVMLLEATGNMQYVLPLMLSVMAARFTGNLFGPAIQDMQIVVKKLPFLEVEMSRSSFGPDGAELTAWHVMGRGGFRSSVTPPSRSAPQVAGKINKHGVSPHSSSSPPKVASLCSPVPRVREVVDLLTSHPDLDFFPVADPHRGGCLVGTILRKTLCQLLQHKRVTFSDGSEPSPFLQLSEATRLPVLAISHAPVAAGVQHGGNATNSGDLRDAAEGLGGGCDSGGFAQTPTNSYHGGTTAHTGNTTTAAAAAAAAAEAGRELPEAVAAAGRGGGGAVSWAELQKPYPRWPQVGDPECAVNDAEKQCWLDLRPYMNAGPYLVQHTTSVGRTYRLFRTLGLRHLCVVDFHSVCVGVVTRQDLSDDALAAAAAEVYARRTSGMDTATAAAAAAQESGRQASFPSFPATAVSGAVGFGPGGGGSSSAPTVVGGVPLRSPTHGVPAPQYGDGSSGSTAQRAETAGVGVVIKKSASPVTNYGGV